ncbi:cobyric acid synthase [bacterium]|nr:cobyric acid synthase [bacterium]
MIQGTSSHVGKSLVVTGLCRIFKQDGLKVAPFKSQNMSNNSFVTEKGEEISRAQVAQAEAAKIKPLIEINPILLKPTSDQRVQVVVKGKVISNMDALTYDKHKRKLFKVVEECYQTLGGLFEVIVIEGAGSPAEINLKNKDIANMKIAHMANSPVILVADIDKGGVFASLVGTLSLLLPKERRRVAGIIINKFRGNLEILRPGLDFIEKKTKIPVLGVIPYLEDIYVSKEDSVDLEQKKGLNKKGQIEIKVIKLPRISNFTDFEPLEKEEVSLQYVSKVNEVGKPDLLIIPGSKNTINDLTYLYNSKLAEKIKEVVKSQGIILGICGGYQMLGRKIVDKYGVESDSKEIDGLNLLNIHTSLNKEKRTSRVKARLAGLKEFIDFDEVIDGYEIHCGETKVIKENFAFEVISQAGKRKPFYKEGSVSKEGRVIGTHLHGIFEDNEFRNKFINYLERKKGIKKGEILYLNRDAEYDKLAEILRKNLNLPKIYEILRSGV